MLLPRQISNSGMTGGGIRVALPHKHPLSSPTLFLTLFPLRLFFFFSSQQICELRQHYNTLRGLLKVPLLVLIGIIARYEAEPLLCLSSYSYHGVIGWLPHSTGISARSRVAGMYPDGVAVVPEGLPRCWIRRVVSCQQSL